MSYKDKKLLKSILCNICTLVVCVIVALGATKVERERTYQRLCEDFVVIEELRGNYSEYKVYDKKTLIIYNAKYIETNRKDYYDLTPCVSESGIVEKYQL